MTMTTDSSSEAIAEIVAGVEAFIDSEVVRRHEVNHALFEDGRNLYTPDGLYVKEVVDLVRQVRESSSEAGYYTMFVPPELGGAGMGATLLFHVWEAIFRRCGAHHWLGWHMIGHWAKGPSMVLAKTTPAMRALALPPLMSGAASACFAISEPDAGSDLRSMRTSAKRDGDNWVINGTKQWITNAPYADYILVFAVNDGEDVSSRRRELTAFLLPASTEGISVVSSIRMFGHSGGDEGVINFDGVVATPDNIVGEVGKGMDVAMLGIGIGKLYNAAKSIGIASWAMDLAAEQVRDRTTFGLPLSERQGVMFPLAESAMELHAARLVAIDCANRLADTSFDGPQVPMMKAFTSEVAVRAIDRVMQTHGASGFTNDLHLTEAWMAIRKICMADGTSEMMRHQIGRAFVSGRLKF